MATKDRGGSSGWEHRARVSVPVVTADDVAPGGGSALHRAVFVNSSDVAPQIACSPVNDSP
jgi:hypothetical protein